MRSSQERDKGRRERRQLDNNRVHLYPLKQQATPRSENGDVTSQLMDERETWTLIDLRGRERAEVKKAGSKQTMVLIENRPVTRRERESERR